MNKSSHRHFEDPLEWDSFVDDKTGRKGPDDAAAAAAQQQAPKVSVLQLSVSMAFAQFSTCIQL